MVGGRGEKRVAAFTVTGSQSFHSQTFRDCWPVYEEKERMRDFQSLAFSTLERLQQDESNCIPNGVFRKTTLGEHGERWAPSTIDPPAKHYRRPP